MQKNAVKTVEYTSVFDHGSDGFDNYGSQKSTLYVNNFAQFNNYYNYALPYNFVQWNYNWSWEAIRVDEKEINKELKKPSNVNTSKKTFYFVREQIVKTVYAIDFP